MLRHIHGGRFTTSRHLGKTSKFLGYDKAKWRVKGKQAQFACPSHDALHSTLSLLVAQRFDRIQTGGAIRGIKAESNADHRANEQSSNRPTIRKDQIHFEPGSEEISDDYSKNDSQDPTGFRNEDCFGQKLPQNVFAARTDRFTHANFFRSFGHADEHDVHDSDARGDQRDETDHERAHPDDAGHGNKRAFEGVVGINLEIVFLVCAQTPRYPHRANGFVERPVVGFGRKRLGRDVYSAFCRAEIFEEARDRHDAEIVLALAERRSFLGQNPDNRVSVPADADDFASWRLVRKQTLLDYFAHDNDVASKIDIFVVNISSITQRVGVGRQEPSVRAA